MLGLSVLFFLGLWITLTIVAMVIGSKFGRKPATKFLGAFLGFMLTMGGFIVHWAIEYYQIQSTVTELCETEGGIKVYVSPEEWRKQIGEEEWNGLAYLDERVKDTEKPYFFIFKGKKYKAGFKTNHRIWSFSIYDSIHDEIRIVDRIYVDTKSKKVLFQKTLFSTGAGAWLAGGSYKQWLNNIKDCDSGSLSNEKRFYDDKYTNFKME